MENAVAEYKLVFHSAEYVNEFEKDVNLLIAQGFHPIGTMFVMQRDGRQVFFKEMIRYALLDGKKLNPLAPVTQTSGRSEGSDPYNLRPAPTKTPPHDQKPPAAKQPHKGVVLPFPKKPK